MRTIVGGDAASLSIAAASVVAKVERDRIMAELALAIPATAGSEMPAIRRSNTARR